LINKIHKMKIVLITGAYGFVGSNLAKSLKDKYTLYALDINEAVPGLYNRFFSWNDIESIPFDTVDTIIHLAGKAHDTKRKSDEKPYFDINVGLTKLVFDKYATSGTDKFIFFSSVKAAADYVEGDFLTEDIIPKPKGAYGESKIKAEEYIQSRSSENKKSYILRPCMIHGPGNKGNLNLLYKFITKGIPYPLGAFDNKRSFTSIDNLIYIINNLISNDIQSGIYNISDDDPVSTNKLIRIMCETLGRRPRIWKIPKAMMIMFARIGSVLGLPLNTFSLNKLTENYIVSNAKIKKAIGVNKLSTLATDGIKKTIESFNNK